MTTEQSTFHKTACILCESNCGIEVRFVGRTFERIRGNKDHVGSKGYTCEKALRLDYYQNSRDRLTLPMRRRADGTHEQVSWETAIGEVADRLAAVRDAGVYGQPGRYDSLGSAGPGCPASSGRCGSWRRARQSRSTHAILAPPGS